MDWRARFGTVIGPGRIRHCFSVPEVNSSIHFVGVSVHHEPVKAEARFVSVFPVSIVQASFAATESIMTVAFWSTPSLVAVKWRMSPAAASAASKFPVLVIVFAVAIDTMSLLVMVAFFVAPGSHDTNTAVSAAAA